LAAHTLVEAGMLVKNRRGVPGRVQEPGGAAQGKWKIRELVARLDGIM